MKNKKNGRGHLNLTQRVALIDELRKLADESGLVPMTPTDVAKRLTPVIGRRIANGTVTNYMEHLGLKHKRDTSTPLARLYDRFDVLEARVTQLEDELTEGGAA